MNPNDKEWWLEKAAEIEHTRWSKWQSWVHGQCIKEGRGEWLTIPEHLVLRWNRQINTKYGGLTEEEKEKDRIEARSYSELFAEATRRGEKKAWEEAKAMFDALGDEYKRKYYVDVTGATKAIAVSVLGTCVRSIDAKLSSLTKK